MQGYLNDFDTLAKEAKTMDNPSARSKNTVSFFKCWDRNGILSNFSPHRIQVDGVDYATVEHFYQSQKLAGVPGSESLVESITNAKSPEEAAFIGRRAERETPDLVRSDWNEVKVAVMEQGLMRKFSSDGNARKALVATGNKLIVESSPHDYFWGIGYNRAGQNWLGRLLMKVRDELR